VARQSVALSTVKRCIGVCFCQLCLCLHTFSIRMSRQHDTRVDGTCIVLELSGYFVGVSTVVEQSKVFCTSGMDCDCLLHLPVELAAESPLFLQSINWSML
jgi:hypothetical protein